MCVSAVNSKWTILRPSTANLLSSIGRCRQFRVVMVSWVCQQVWLVLENAHSLPQGRCHGRTCTPPPPPPPSSDHTDRRVHTYTHPRPRNRIKTDICTNMASHIRLNLFLLYSFLICRSLFLFFSHIHTRTYTQTHTLTKLTCQLQSDQEQKDSCQFEADIINGFGRGRALKTKGVQGRADLKCTFILAGTLAFWFQPLYANIFLRVALTFIIAGEQRGVRDFVVLMERYVTSIMHFLLEDATHGHTWPRVRERWTGKGWE